MKHSRFVKIFSSLLAICLMVSLTLTFNASAASSGEKNLPSFTSATWKSTSVYTVASASGAATFYKTTVAFSDYDTLNSSFVSSNSRAFSVEVYDDDGLASGDDLIETYSVNFTGRTISKTWTRVINGTSSTKLDDGSSNKDGEIFLKFRMTKMSGDKATGVGEAFFKFNITIA